MLRPGLDWTVMEMRAARDGRSRSRARRSRRASLPAVCSRCPTVVAAVLCVPFGRTQSHPTGAGEAVSAGHGLRRRVADQAGGHLRRAHEADRERRDRRSTRRRARSLPELVADGGERDHDRAPGRPRGRFPDSREVLRAAVGRRARRRGDRARGAGAHGRRRRRSRIRPGQVARYSDLGYILLGAALERAAGERLDALARGWCSSRSACAAPSSSTSSGRARSRRPAVAPTEVCAAARPAGRRGARRERARRPAASAATPACSRPPATWRASPPRCSRRCAGERRALRSGHRARAWSTTPSTPGSTWRLGWDTPSRAPGVSHAGDRWPRDGVRPPRLHRLLDVARPAARPPRRDR